ncbi:phage holin family protein [Corynebacterium aquatimens]|nr:phage holin family protein [Corynebacterium aquatimens]
MRFITDIIVTILALWLVTAIVPGVEVNGGVGSFIWVALVFMFVNAVISPILHTLSLPLKIVTFGIFSLLVNTLLFSITGWLSGLNISGFWAAFFGAIVMTIALWIVEGIFSALGAKNTEATV